MLLCVCTNEVIVVVTKACFAKVIDDFALMMFIGAVWFIRTTGRRRADVCSSERDITAVLKSPQRPQKDLPQQF